MISEEAVDKALNATVPGGAQVMAWLPLKANGNEPHDTARNVMRVALEAAYGEVVEAAMEVVQGHVVTISNGGVQSSVFKRHLEDPLFRLGRILKKNEEKQMTMQDSRCDCCLRDDEGHKPVGVASSSLTAYSYSFCVECLRNHAESQMAVNAILEETPVNFIRQEILDGVHVFYEGEYITMRDYAKKREESNEGTKDT